MIQAFKGTFCSAASRYAAGVYAGLLLCFPLAAGAQSVANPQHPNIVLIVADDMGYGDLSCYGDGKIVTPNVDQLAATGIKFKDASAVSSICSPSRYSILTGRYSWRTRLKFGVLSWFAKPLIEPNRTTLASELKRNGYDTACVGKWHLGLGWALKTNAPANPDQTVFSSWERQAQDYIDFSKPITQGPLDRGFDYFFGIAGSLNMIPFVYIENNRVVEPPSVPKKEVYEFDQNCLCAPDWDSRTVNQVLTRKAVDVINSHFSKPDGKPLFLYFPTSAIHRPCLPTFTKGKSRAGLVGDMVLEFDWSVAQVVAALKQNHALDNTLLIITSDNGPYPGDPLLGLEKYHTEDYAKDLWQPYFSDFKPQYMNPNSSPVWKTGWLTYGHKTAGDFLGFKEDPWEGGLRIPLILHWPAGIKSPQTNYNMVCLSDLMATFADVVGDHLKTGEGEDSYSFYPYLFNTNAPSVRKSMVLSAGGSGAMVAREGDWKFIQGAENPHWERTYWPLAERIKDRQLYDLKVDISEQTNLFNAKPEIAGGLRRLIRQVEQNAKTEGNSPNQIPSVTKIGT
jgi:arylsulfatase A-like enzyme